MNIQNFKEMMPMKYWSLPAKASEGQKEKLKKAVRSDNYYAVLKKDGAWYRFIKGDGELLLQSRTISKKTDKYVEKQDNVPHIMADLNNLMPDNTVVIGEIYLPNNTNISSDVISIMGCLPQKAQERQKEIKLHYYIFDILMYDGMDVHLQPATRRIELLQKISKNNKSEYIEFAHPVFENLEETISEWLAAGEEGAVLMQKDKGYVYGKSGRSAAWHTIKFKQTLMDNIDLVIVGLTPPVREYTGKYPQSWSYWENLKTGELVEGNYWTNGGYQPVSEYYFKGLIGGFELGAYYDDKLISVGKVANLTDELRINATTNPNDFIGQVVEVNAMSVDTQRQSLRHAKLVKMRPDKNAAECLYEEIF